MAPSWQKSLEILGTTSPRRLRPLPLARWPLRREEALLSRPRGSPGEWSWARMANRESTTPAISPPLSCHIAVSLESIYSLTVLSLSPHADVGIARLSPRGPPRRKTLSSTTLHGHRRRYKGLRPIALRTSRHLAGARGLCCTRSRLSTRSSRPGASSRTSSASWACSPSSTRAGCAQRIFRVIYIATRPRLVAGTSLASGCAVHTTT